VVLGIEIEIESILGAEAAGGAPAVVWFPTGPTGGSAEHPAIHGREHIKPSGPQALMALDAWVHMIGSSNEPVRTAPSRVAMTRTGGHVLRPKVAQRDRL